jgi:hypothetical protein
LSLVRQMWHKSGTSDIEKQVRSEKKVSVGCKSAT